MMNYDINERIAAQETKMATVLEILSKREQFQSDVLTRLTQIQERQQQAIDYQRACDAERKAYEVRITGLENSRKIVLVMASFVSGTVGIIIAVAGLILHRG